MKRTLVHQQVAPDKQGSPNQSQRPLGGRSYVAVPQPVEDLCLRLECVVLVAVLVRNPWPQPVCRFWEGDRRTVESGGDLGDECIGHLSDRFPIEVEEPADAAMAVLHQVFI